MFRDFSQKSDLLERHTPVLPYTASTPPPLMCLRRWLAHIYKLQCFSVGIFGGLPPPPPQYQEAGYRLLPIPTEVIRPTLSPLFFACLSAFPPENEPPFLGEDFFFGGGRGGGACQLNILVPPYENPRPPAPQCPPTENNPSYATAPGSTPAGLQPTPRAIPKLGPKARLVVVVVVVGLD